MEPMFWVLFAALTLYAAFAPTYAWRAGREIGREEGAEEMRVSVLRHPSVSSVSHRARRVKRTSRTA